MRRRRRRRHRIMELHFVLRTSSLLSSAGMLSTTTWISLVPQQDWFNHERHMQQQYPILLSHDESGSLFDRSGCMAWGEDDHQMTTIRRSLLPIPARAPHHHIITIDFCRPHPRRNAVLAPSTRPGPMNRCARNDHPSCAL